MELGKGPRNATRSVGHSEVWMPGGVLLNVRKVRCWEHIADANYMFGLTLEENHKMTQKYNPLEILINGAGRVSREIGTGMREVGSLILDSPLNIVILWNRRYVPQMYHKCNDFKNRLYNCYVRVYLITNWLSLFWKQIDKSSNFILTHFLLCLFLRQHKVPCGCYCGQAPKCSLLRDESGLRWGEEVLLFNWVQFLGVDVTPSPSLSP